MMRKFQPSLLASSSSEFEHSLEYIARRETQLAAMDGMNTEERALIHEFGFDRAMLAIRLNYGRPHIARAYLETEREQLQVERLRNISFTGFVAALKHR